MKACPVLMIRAEWSRVRPRMGRSRDLSRPWSASTRLLAEGSVWCQAPGASSSRTGG
jgi:hypothetical protein